MRALRVHKLGDKSKPQIERTGKRTKLIQALVNSGFESSEPEIILPPSIGNP